MKLLNNKALEEATKGILKDHIIWERVARAIRIANNAVHPNDDEEEFEPDCQYIGYGNAFDVLGIRKEHDLTGILGEMVYHKLIECANVSAKILAEEMYNDWLIAIKDYFINKNHHKICKV